jgi:hypothetical protein
MNRIILTSELLQGSVDKHRLDPHWNPDFMIDLRNTGKGIKRWGIPKLKANKLIIEHPAQPVQNRPSSNPCTTHTFFSEELTVVQKRGPWLSRALLGPSFCFCFIIGCYNRESERLKAKDEESKGDGDGCCLLWRDKARTKLNTYIWVSV